MRPLQPTVRQLTTPAPSPVRRRRRPIRQLAILGALIGATGLAACGSSGDATPASAAPATATPTAAATAAKPAAHGSEAKIAEFAFSPADIQVHVGDKITWTNDDAAAHTVTATSGADFDSGTLANGATFTFEAKKAGSIAYICTIHPSMKGTITVR